MNQITVLLQIALALYCIAGTMFAVRMFSGSRRLSLVAYGVAGLGVLAHTAALMEYGFHRHSMPFTNLFGALTFFAWGMVALYLAVERRCRIVSLGTFVCAVAVAVTACTLMLPRDVSVRLIPALQNRWSTVHIGSALLSYSGFVLAFGASLGYWLQERMLKTKRINAIQKHLPPLDVLDRFAYRMVTLSFPMLTLGIITGALWAQDAWGSYWSWDPKEIWALITWLIYAAYLHVRVMQGWRGKRANRLLLTGFVSVIVTFVGVNLLSNGMHKYNW